MKPKISVLTTVYNGETYLTQTIKSVLNQTFKDFEWIIIDDGSTDNTKKIIKSFRDKRIKYHYHGINQGFSKWGGILNFGLEKCGGKYIARLDADDICYPNRLERQFKYLEKNKDIFMIGSSCDVIDKNGRIIDKILKKEYPSIFYKFYVAFSNSFIHSSIMFRNEGLKYPNEIAHNFYFNMLVNNKKIKNMKDILVQYRINPTGIMATETNLKGSKYEGFYLDGK